MIFRWIRSRHPLARLVLWSNERRIERLREDALDLKVNHDQSTRPTRKARLSAERLAVLREIEQLEGLCEGLHEQIAGKHDGPKLRRVA